MNSMERLSFNRSSGALNSPVTGAAAHMSLHLNQQCQRADASPTPFNRGTGLPIGEARTGRAKTAPSMSSHIWRRFPTVNGFFRNFSKAEEALERPSPSASADNRSRRDEPDRTGITAAFESSKERRADARSSGPTGGEEIPGPPRALSLLDFQRVAGGVEARSRRPVDLIHVRKANRPCKTLFRFFFETCQWVGNQSSVPADAAHIGETIAPVKRLFLEKPEIRRRSVSRSGAGAGNLGARSTASRAATEK